MAASIGTKAPTVVAALAARGHSFTFLQAMWLLQRAASDAVPLGHQGPPGEEPVRLCPSVSLAFPPGDIESFTPGQADEGRQSRLTTTFMGLYGAHSPLPNYYSENILHVADDDEDHPVRAFLDIFNHRLLSLLYRGLVKYRGHLLFERDGTDEFSWRLFALAGFAPQGALKASGLSGPRLLRYAGLWSQAPRSAVAVAAILSTYLKEPSVQIEPCTARWVYLDDTQHSRLGENACCLGTDATIGSRVADRSGKFRIRIGPVDFATYQKYLPGGDGMDTLRRLAPLAAGDWLAFDVKVILRSEDTPRLGIQLGEDAALGWTAGLFSESHEDMAVVFE